MPANPLSPVVMLSTSMHAQPGVYALLLGSGVSTGAGIPTGWGVVKEMVRRIAAASGGGSADEAAAEAQDDPEKWWAEYGTGALRYSNLLEALAPTAPARQGLLAEFFEPSDEDREEGTKVPSRAHHAVAQLVKRGLVRVIITTNFDRLTEQALEAAGVSPQVIARPEAANGMAPLAHSRATVIKLHGDYRDLGTRNTSEELSEYPQEWKTLLQQVFDEYGLLISGWSADSDAALVEALETSPNRRYPLYWDSRSSKGDAAQRVLTNRSGLVIPSAGADELFGDLLGSIDALDRLAQPPLTTAMAVARLKRYLPDPVRRIDLSDLVMDATNDVATFVGEQSVTATSLDGEKIQRIYEGYIEATTPLAHLLVTGVWHDLDGTHDRLWVDALQRLIDAGTAPISSATTGLDYARRWPALFAMTAMSVAAVRRDRERLFIRLGTEPAGRGQMGTAEPSSAADLLHPNRLLTKAWVDAMPRWGGTTWIYPASHILKADIRRFIGELIPLDSDYVDAFHGYEYRLGLIQENRIDGRGYRALSGEYVGERQWVRDDREGDVPRAELAFRDDAKRSLDWPWPDYIDPENFNDIIVAHRDVLKNHRGAW